MWAWITSPADILCDHWLGEYCLSSSCHTTGRVLVSGARPGRTWTPTPLWTTDGEQCPLPHAAASLWPIYGERNWASWGENSRQGGLRHLKYTNMGEINTLQNKTRFIEWRNYTANYKRILLYRNIFSNKPPCKCGRLLWSLYLTKKKNLLLLSA